MTTLLWIIAGGLLMSAIALVGSITLIGVMHFNQLAMTLLDLFDGRAPGNAKCFQGGFQFLISHRFFHGRLAVIPSCYCKTMLD